MNEPTPGIHPAAHPGPVSLTVPSLERSLEFYTSRLGLQQRGGESNVLRLGTGARDLLLLHELPGAVPAPRATGLYHFALLLPSRAQLGLALRHLAETATPLQGASDHLVSESLYLADPDGNGIELYRDRPREDWVIDGNGVRMATDPLDVEAVLTEAAWSGAPWSGMPDETVMGHMHLRVSDIAASERFYRDILGFDLMARLGPSASFLSAGGYHHHLAVNTWGTAGAPAPPKNAAGLREWTLLLPTETAVQEVESRLSQAGFDATRSDAGLDTRDPSGNALLVMAEAR